MNIEDRYTAVPRPFGGVCLIPIQTTDAAPDPVTPIRRLVRARTGDDLLTGNLKSPRRISLGRTFTPTSGEAHQGAPADDHIPELQPGRNFACNEFVHAEDIEVVMKELGMEKEQAVMLLGRLPKEALGPFVNDLRKSAHNAARRRSTSVVNSYAATMAEEGDRRNSATRMTSDSQLPANIRSSGNVVLDYKVAMEQYAATKGA